MWIPTRAYKTFRCWRAYDVARLDEWNDTAVLYPVVHSLQALVEEQLGQSPEVIAVSTSQASLTRGELQGRSNQMAHLLQGQRYSAGDRVVVLMERSLEFVVSLLGILKAGATYVPLDPRSAARAPC